jgi:hypothetical protein
MFQRNKASKLLRVGNANAVYMRHRISSPDVTFTSSVTMEAGANLESQSGAIPFHSDVFKLADARRAQSMDTRTTNDRTGLYFS